MTPLTQDDKTIIAEEEAVLLDVKKAIQIEKKNHVDDKGVNRDAFLNLLKDSSSRNEADMPTLLQELHIKKSLENRERPIELLDADSPYFAHLILKEEKKTRNLLLGYSTFLSTKCSYSIVDWRNAPSAKLFYNYREGDEFVQELPNRVAEGIVSARRVLTIKKSILKKIQLPDRVLVKNESGEWQRFEMGQPHLAGGAQKAVRGVKMGVGRAGELTTDVSALLDENQFALLNEDPHKPLLILGGAGSGKTTVALHRIANLHFKDPKRFNEKSIAVIVPDEGLRRLSINLLGSIGMHNVEVSTFDTWIHKQGRHMMRNIPHRLCDETPAKVIRFKRHFAMMEAVDIYLESVALETRKTLLHDFSILSPLAQEKIPRFTKDFCFKDWLRSLEEKAAKIFTRHEMKLKGLNEYFSRRHRRLDDITEDRKTLFTDHIILKKAAALYSEVFDESYVEDLIKHTRHQLMKSSKKMYQDVDDSRKMALDGRDISDDIDAIAGTIDVEDYPILFKLMEHKLGKMETHYGRLKQYSHMVLDEAQELPPMELNVLAKALKEPKSITIAGDIAQQTDVTTSFRDWQYVLDTLGLEGVKPSKLTTNYRSPAPVGVFAHKVLGDLAGPLPEATKDGAPVQFSSFDTYGEGIFVLLDVLGELMENEPYASIAIIARDAKGAKRLYKDLDKLPDARLVTEGDFSFTAGIDVTHVADIKGLEFDYVILPDVDSHIYPDDAMSRRTLHVAATRAVHQLWVLSMIKRSPVIDFL